MLRGLAVFLVLVSVGLLGCSKSSDPRPKSIPEIPKGRSAVGPEAGRQMPVAPAGKR